MSRTYTNKWVDDRYDVAYINKSCLTLKDDTTDNKQTEK